MTAGNVPFLDLGRLHASIRSELDDAFETTLRDSSFIEGRAVRTFEDAFGAAHDAPAAAGCGSGTDALVLALRVLGIGPGDEVVIPAMTFIATAEAVVHVGATPVIADVDPRTLLLAPPQVEAVRTSSTRAVIPVHLYGHVVPFDHLQLWRDSGLIVVEDAAQAHLATWRGRFVGSVGHAACFSFYPGKNLGALGDGGLVLCPEEAMAEEVRRLRNHGRATKYEHDVIGLCSRLDGLQAAALAVKLRHLQAWTEARRARAGQYRDLLGERLVPWEAGAVHHLIVARVADRDRVRAGLGAARIETGKHYPTALSRQPSVANWAKPCPAAEAAACEVLSLPMDPLMSEAEVAQVAGALVEALS